MTTNQEGRQAAIRESTGTTWAINGDWHALWDAEGIDAGSWDERMLSWLNAELGASYTNLMGAMHAYAAANGYSRWTDIGTFSLSGASSLLSGEDEGLAFDFTDQSVRIKDTGTPANAYNSTGTVSSGALVGPGGKLTYTSPSNKLTRQADGVIRYQAHNLCTYSEDLTNVNWLKGGSSATAVDTITEDGSTGAHRVYRQFASLPTADYRIKVRISASDRHIYFIAQNSSNLVYAWINTSTWTIAESGDNGSVTLDSATLTAVGDGTYDLDIVARNLVGAFFIQFYMADTIGTGPNPPSYAGDTVSTLAVSRIQLNLYPANTDYIKTTTAAKYALPIEYDTSGNCLGLLVEEQRTNLCLYSNDLTQAGSWTASNMTTAKTATGPDNVANSATTITATAGNATILQAITSTSAARVTSVFIKRRAGTGNIDLTQDNGATWTTQAVDSTWTRFSLSSVTSANPTVGIRIVTSGDAVDVALFSHEVGALVTSPILTYGAAATRNADPLSQLTSTFPLSATAGSFYAYVAPYAGADLAGIVSLNDGAGNEEIVIYKDASANIVAQVEDGGVNQLAPLDSTVNASSGTAFKVALAWAANDFALSADGTAAQTDTGGTLPTVTTLEIGVDQANNYFNGHIKAISYVPRRKSNAELQAETA